MNDISRYSGLETLTVSEVMQKIDLNSSGILFLTDKEGHLTGCITDGDIRRYLLSGGNMTDHAITAANVSPRRAKNVSEAKTLYHQKSYVAIPVVSDEGELVDVYIGEDGLDTARKRNPLRIPVVINAGGRGTRLDPYTRVLPKPLIPVGELPIIELIMQEYLTYECCEFHIIVNYKKDLLKAYFADNENNYQVTWYDEEKPLGTGGGLSLLKGKLDSTFFFANCDALIRSDYESAVKFHKDNKNDITMLCAYKNINIPYGVVEMGVNGTIEDMKEKPLMSFLTNTGMYIVEPEIVDDVKDDTFIGFPDIINNARRAGKRVAAYPISENDWMDMGQIDELEKMRSKLYG